MKLVMFVGCIVVGHRWRYIGGDRATCMQCRRCSRFGPDRRRKMLGVWSEIAKHTSPRRRSTDFGTANPEHYFPSHSRELWRPKDDEFKT
jgi:hypothetical protein